jgi:arsenate reductase
MAEALLRLLGGDDFNADSAGLEPGVLNPLAIEVLKEEGIDISDKPTKDVFECFKQGHLYHYVITVCDEASAERCPVFPGVTRRLSWSFPDPSKFVGSMDDRLVQTRLVRDQIKLAIQDFIENARKDAYKF